MRFLPGTPRPRVSRSLQALRHINSKNKEPIDEVLKIIDQLREEDPKFVAMMWMKLMEFCYPKPKSEDFEDVDNVVDVGPTQEQVKKLWDMKRTREEFSEET